MREILFRGKNVKDGNWAYGSLLDWRDGTYEIREECNEPFRGTRGITVDKDTIGQFTGLTDKNGAKIFEGDIVMFNRKRNLPNYTPVPELIKYHQGDCAFQRFPFGKSLTKGLAGKLIQPDMMSECEVIGNVHDNPNMLISAKNDDSENIADTPFQPVLKDGNFELMPG